MPNIKAHNAAPARKRKSGTISQNRFRFVSFTQRVASLSINPVSRARRQDTQDLDDDDDSSTSHFVIDFSKWRDLNLSAHFVQFARDIEPLCETLPQILYYQDQLVDRLVDAIENGSSHSLEPLLDLVSALAHDLGYRFERHFPRVLAVILSAPLAQKEVEVIEWSFTALAWLFKYLSRLLVLDLRSTFDAVAPYLGRAHNKPHLARFAAEALSFLLRKAATQRRKDGYPLWTITDHVLRDGSVHHESETYQYGLMNLFANAIKGVNEGLHSSGLTIFETLLSVASDERCIGTITGIFVNLTHHCNPQSLTPLLNKIVEGDYGTRDEEIQHKLREELLLHAVSVRNGSRIFDWKTFLDAVFRPCSLSSTGEGEFCDCRLERIQVVSLAHAPLDIVIPYIQRYTKAVSGRRTRERKSATISLAYYYTLNRDRFGNLILPHVKEILNTTSPVTDDYNLLLMHMVLPSLSKQVQRFANGLGWFCIPTTLRDSEMQTFATLSEENREKVNAYLDLVPHMPLESPLRGMVINGLMELVRPHDLPDDSQRLLLGNGLRALLRTGSSFDLDLGISVSAFLDCCLNSLDIPMLLENIIISVQTNHVTFEQLQSRSIPLSLQKNLRSPSSKLRSRSLNLLHTICPEGSATEKRLLDTAISIENTPVDLHNARKLAMFVREMLSNFSGLEEDSWLKPAFPYFCFGLLTYRLSELWTVAIESLGAVSSSTTGESIITNTVSEWLASQHDEGPRRESQMHHQSSRSTFNEFQEFKAEHAKEHYENIVTTVGTPESYFHTIFMSELESSSSLMNLRTQALRVLRGLPRLAEKRSRHLVPLFLAWTSEGDDCVEDSDSQSPPSSRSSREQLLMFLDVFAVCQNPRTLFHSEQIYNRLLRLISHHDAAVQKKALDAIMTWKQPGVVSLDESLHNLLDESRFREELVHICQSQAVQDTGKDQRAEVMQVLLNLLFGRMAASPRAAGNNTQQSRRRAILDCFHQFTDEDINELLSISVASAGIENLSKSAELSSENGSLTMNKCRRLLGLVNLIKDMLHVMGSRLLFLAQRLIRVIIGAVRLVSNGSHTEGPPDLSSQSTTSLGVRQQGTKCLTLVFKHLSDASFSDHVSTIFELLITPRLENLPAENAQSVSSLFELLSVWACSPSSVSFLGRDLILLQKIADVLTLPYAKEDVKIFALDNILLPWSVNAESSGSDRVNLDKREHFIDCCNALLRGDISRKLLASAVRFVLQLAPSITGESQVRSLLEILKLLLEKQYTLLSISSRRDLIHVMREILPYGNLTPDHGLYYALFDSFGSMLGTIQDAVSRSQLCLVLETLIRNDQTLHNVALICSDLNSNTQGAIDHPDFDRRRNALNAICANDCAQYTSREWSPLLHNLVYYMRVVEDFGISMSCRVALCSAIGKLNPDNGTTQLLDTIVLPALRYGARAISEETQKNCLVVMAHTVKCHPNHEQIGDLTCLLMNNDEEASIFNNLYHVQQHRRLRALRRLASKEITSSLGSRNVSQFLIPLLEHFVYDKDSTAKAGEVGAEAITTISSLCSRMEWPQARALLRRYITFMSSKEESEKSTFRLLGTLIDATVVASNLRESAMVAESELLLEEYPLKRTMAGRHKLCEDFTTSILPPLTSYLHQKDESVVSLRVPIAVSIVKALMIFPEAEIAVRLPPVLTDLCQILRSKSDESRDLVRKTLSEITQVIGAKYFGFVVRELRAALVRGYQLHVLSYTVHTLLVESIPLFVPGDIDYCLPDLGNIIVDDIFGATGQEKDAEDYSGKSKEIKSRKSFDSMELLGSKVSIKSVGVLVKPIQALLCEKINLKTVRKVDELLRRLTVGLLKNDAAEGREALTICFELLQRAYTNPGREKAPRSRRGQNRFLVNLKGRKAGTNNAQGSSYEFKILCFAFDLLRTLVVKFESLRTPANLTGFLPALGDAMLQNQDEVQVAAMRLLAVIIRVPMPELDKDGAVYLGEAIKVVQTATSLNTDLVQSALKLVTAYIRDRPDVPVKDTSIAQLLKTLRSELDRSESQGLIFNFLKAVIGRSTALPEIYDIMDSVAAMMVTHMSRDTRHMARAVYLQFLLNSPQGTTRLNKQISFLRSNLQYPHVEGRQAVMEAVNLLLVRVDQDLQHEIIGTFFNPMVLVLVNDDSPDCRKMAGLLLGAFLKAASAEKVNHIIQETDKWLSQTDNVVLTRAGFQVYGAILDTVPEHARQKLSYLRSLVVSTVKEQVEEPENASWELIYYALQAVDKMAKAFEPFILAAESQDLWDLIQRSLFYPHKWVKTTCATLTELQLSEFIKTARETASHSWPVQSEYGLIMNESDSVLFVQRLLRALYSPELSEDLANAVIRNLVILAQLAYGLSGQRQNGGIDMSGLGDGFGDDEELRAIGEVASKEGLEPGQYVLQLIFRNMSTMIRKEPALNEANALVLRGAAIRLCATLCNDNGLPIEAFQAFIQDVLQPMYSLVDPNIPTPFSTDQKFKDTWNEQVGSAREILESLQKRLGSAEFLNHSSRIQARVRERREERRTKRKLEAITAPERVGKAKQKKGERLKQRRKEKAAEFRDRRRLQ